MKNRLSAGILCALLIQMPVSAALQKKFTPKTVDSDKLLSAWNRTESVYNTAGSVSDGSYVESVADFCTFIEQYGGGYEVQMFRNYFAETDELYKTLRFHALELYQAARSGDMRSISQARIDVLDSIADWMNLESSSLLQTGDYYFILILLLLGVIMVFIVAVLLYARQLEKSKGRDQESADLNAQILKAQEDERARISRELHDTVAQDMRYTSLLAAASSDDAAAEKIRANQNKCIDELRSLCYNLSPPDLDSGDFGSAMQMLCTSFRNTSGIDVRLTIPQNTDFSFLNKETALNLYRLIQEALNNTAKHARAHETTVLLRNGGDGRSLSVFITDDGCGMDDALVAKLNAVSGVIKTDDGAEHFGVRGMKERVRLLGGVLEFNSMTGEGTEVSITVPYKKQ